MEASKVAWKLGPTGSKVAWKLGPTGNDETTSTTIEARSIQ